MEHKTVGFAVCGSFCTHHRAMEALEAVKARYDHVIPIVSEVVADTDTRFGTAHDLMRDIYIFWENRVIYTQKEAEPIGPKGRLDLLIIAPCTGSTLGKLACGIADTTVTLAAKAHLRNCRPILLAPSTNDGLAASARNLGQLMARKYIYLVPFRQDDPEEKPASLVADFSLVADAAQAALEGRQLQPVAKDIPLALPRQIKISVVGQVQQGVPLLRRGGIVDNEGILLGQAVAHLHMQFAGITLLTCFCRMGEHHHIINVLGAPLPQAAVKASLAAVQVVAAVIGSQLILLAV